MLKFLFYCVIALIVGVLIKSVFGSGGGIAFRGTEKYNRYQRDADAKVKEILKNGSGSTKAELQEWWDTYHK